MSQKPEVALNKALYEDAPARGPKPYLFIMM